MFDLFLMLAPERPSRLVFLQLTAEEGDFEGRIGDKLTGPILLCCIVNMGAIECTIRGRYIKANC